MGLHLSWHTSLCAEQFPAKAYETLRLEVAGSTPFNHLAWLQAAERALAPGQRLYVLLGHLDGRLCLCLPLVRERRSLGPLQVPQVYHLGYPLSDRIALLVDLPATYADEVLRTIRQRLPHAVLQLSEVVALSEPWWQRWRHASATVERRVSCRVPTHRVTPLDHQEVGGDPRYKLRRARKRIAARGGVVRRVVPDRTTVAEWLARIAAVEAASWKGDDAIGIFSGDTRRRWINEAFGALAEANLVRLVLLEVDGRCVSYRLGLLEDGRLYDYNLAFLPMHRDLGSGRVLLDEWIRWGLDDGWTWVDASRVSRTQSSHQLHERQTDTVEQWRLSCYSWRPDGIVLGLALLAWRWLGARGWRRRATRPVAPTPQEI